MVKKTFSKDTVEILREKPEKIMVDWP